MRFLDKKFKENKRQYIFQSLLAGFTVALALVFLDVVRQPVIIASFGASAFVAFTVPHLRISGPKNLIGGYVVGVIVGVLIHNLAEIFNSIYLLDRIMTVIAGGAAVVLAVFFMTITDTEHAPATSIALGLVINEWTYHTVILILLGIIIISTVQRFLRPQMIDLL
ncbi:MAG: HPP family protein [Candidatus Omnitrophota bacterium]